MALGYNWQAVAVDWRAAYYDLEWRLRMANAEFADERRRRLWLERDILAQRSARVETAQGEEKG